MGVKISELNSAEQVQNNDVLPIVQNDETKKVTKEILLQEVVASLSEKAEADNVYTKEESNTLLNGKVDKVAGKGLSTEDYTTEDKGQVATNKIDIGTLQADSGATIELEMNTTNYVLTANLKNKAGTVVSTTGVDLPIESAIVDGYYDNVNKKIVLVLQNGNTIDVPVGDLISGLQAEITSDNKLSSDLVDDTNKTNKFVTTTEKTNWNAKYDKPNSGIPKSDLSSEVQTSLEKADTALQEHQDISGKEDKSNKVIEITDESTDIEYPSAKAVYDSQNEQNTEIEELQGQVEILENTVESELEDGTATGESISVTDSANAPAKLLPSGNTYQATNVKTYTCTGEETGDYYFTYNSINYQFTMPTIEAGSILAFNTDTLKLYLGETEITTTTDNTGTLITLQDTPNSKYPQQIHVVKGHNEFLYQNKNLIKYSELLWGYRKPNDRTDEHWVSTDFIKVSENTSYIFSHKLSTNTGNIYEYDKNKNLINIKNSNQILNNFTTDIGITYVSIGVWNSNNISAIEETWMQLEPGVTATSYVPHEEQTLELDLPAGMEMCETGNYADAFEKQDGKWYKNEIIGDHLFTGNENIQKTGDVFYTDDIGDNILVSGTICLSNRMKGIANTNTGSSILADTCCFRISGFSRFYFNMSSITTDINTIEQYLAENETHLKYIRNAIRPIEITDPTLISQLDAMQKVLSYYGGTNITTISAGDLEPILNLDYKKSNRLRIEALENAIISLGGNV